MPAQVRPESPIDLAKFKRVKDQKKENKNLIQIWYSEFKRKNNRKPNDQEAIREIKGLLEGRQRLIKDYTLMKAKLFNQTGEINETIKDFSPRNIQIVN